MRWKIEQTTKCVKLGLRFLFLVESNSEKTDNPHKQQRVKMAQNKLNKELKNLKTDPMPQVFPIYLCVYACV